MDITIHSSQADVVLELLRCGDIDLVEEIMGRPITRCPPAVPPWPPKPVARRSAPERRVDFVGVNSNLPNSKLFRDFSILRRGMTESQILARGISRRDLRHWIKKGMLTWRVE